MWEIILREAATSVPSAKLKEAPKVGTFSGRKAPIGVELRENPARWEIPRSLLVLKLVLSANVTEICRCPTGTDRAQVERRTAQDFCGLATDEDGAHEDPIGH